MPKFADGRRCARTVVLTALVVLACASPSEADFNAPQRLSDAADEVSLSSAARGFDVAPTGRAIAGWRAGATKRAEAALRGTTAGFGDDEALSEASSDAADVDAAIGPDGTAAVAWRRHADPAQPALWRVEVRVRPAGASAFGPVQPLSAADSATIGAPQVTVDAAGDVNVAWIEGGSLIARTRPASGQPFNGPQAPAGPGTTGITEFQLEAYGTFGATAAWIRRTDTASTVEANRRDPQTDPEAGTGQYGATNQTLDTADTAGGMGDLRLGVNEGGTGSAIGAALVWTRNDVVRGTWRPNTVSVFGQVLAISGETAIEDAPDADAYDQGAWFTWAGKAGGAPRWSTHAREGRYANPGQLDPRHTLSDAETSDVVPAPRIAVAHGGDVAVAFKRRVGQQPPYDNSAVYAATRPANAFGGFERTIVDASTEDMTAPRVGIDAGGVATVLWVAKQAEGYVVQAADDGEPASAVTFASDYRLDEGGESDFVRLSRPAGGAPGSVDLIQTGGAAAAGDFDVPDGPGVAEVDGGWRISFADGETVKDVPVTVTDDAADEGDESLTLALTNPQGNATFGIPSTKATKITDDDGPLVSIADADAVEGDRPSEERKVEFTVSLSAATNHPVGFSWSTSLATGASAAGADDFEAMTGQTGQIAAGTTTAKIAVPIKEDETKEGDEDFRVTLSAFTGGRPGTKVTATGTIADDDGLEGGQVITAPRPTPVADAPPRRPGAIGGAGGRPALPDPRLEAVPAQRIRKVVRMPDFRPGSTFCTSQPRRICTREAVTQWLTANVQTFRLFERNGDLDSVRSGALRRRVDHDDVIEASPEPGAKLAVPDLFNFPQSKVPDVTVRIYRHRQLDVKCGEGGLKTRLLETPDWPGESSGAGRDRRYGALDLLEKLRCQHRVRYRKTDGVAKPTITDVEPGDVVKVSVALPRTEELELIMEEGARHPDLRGRSIVGLLPDGRMPTSEGGVNAVVVHVLQRTTAPHLPLPGAVVEIRNPKGKLVADAVTTREGCPLRGERFDPTSFCGSAALVGKFKTTGRYTVTASLVGDNGLSMDGNAELRVREESSPLTTQSGRLFKKTGDGWVLKPPLGSAARAPRPVGRAAQVVPICEGLDPARPTDNQAFAIAGQLLERLRAISFLPPGAEREAATGRFINSYLAAQKFNLLQRAPVQKLVKEYDVSVANAGTGQLEYKGGSNLCVPILREEARRLARGYDVGSGPIPAIVMQGALVLPNSRIIDSAIAFDPTIVFKPTYPQIGFPPLTLDERVLILEAVMASPPPLGSDSEILPVLREALGGVIASGGGNVIASGGGNVIASGGGNLTPDQLRAVMLVIASASDRVIASGGGNFSESQAAIIRSIRDNGQVIASGGGNVIASGGGNVIASGGGNMTGDMLRGLLGVIASGGGNIIASGGGNLSGLEQQLVKGVIASGGGNVIASGGGNVIASGGGNITSGDVMQRGVQGVIASGGGNLTEQGLKSVQAVIASGGGNVIASGGGNVISSDGASLQSLLLGPINAVIASGGGNLIGRLADLQRVKGVIASGGGNLGARQGELVGHMGADAFDEVR